MTLEQVRDISVLAYSNLPLFRMVKPGPICMGRGRTDGVYADKEQIQVTEGTVDLFTKTEYDPVANQIQQAMNNSEMTWYKNSTQYEGRNRIYTP